MENSKTVTFSLGGMIFEYDEKKNKINIEKHGISFKSAARVFFDYDRIEYYDEENSNVEDRYDIIGDLSAGTAQIERNTEIMIGNIKSDDVLFVVYTERIRKNENGAEIDVTRLISARYATNFERGFIMVNTKEMTESLIKELAFSEEELRELKAAKEKPIVFDEDCPETTPERALKFRRVNPPRGAGKKRA